MSPEKIASHEPTSVKRDPEGIREAISGSAEESKDFKSVIKSRLMFVT
jgi:hypothetical protein